MKKIWGGLVLLSMSACTVSQSELAESKQYCEDKEGVYELRFDAWELVVLCKNGEHSHLADIRSHQK